MKMRITKTEAARKIAELLRDNLTTHEASSITIGLMLDGTVDKCVNAYGNLAEMAVAVADTGDGWMFGDFDGDPTAEKHWTEEDIEALAECFSDSWIEDAIFDADIDVEWKDEPTIPDPFRSRWGDVANDE